MKDHTQEEKAEAKKKLPRPVYDFLGSLTLTKIYQGIAQKLKLNFRQIFAVAEITNLTLIGLEPESAIETNIHQFLPELSNEKTRELVADINDRVFKEAKRRLQEGILEPDAEPLPPPLTDAELDALVEKEEREKIKPEFEKQKEEEVAREPELLKEEEARAARNGTAAAANIEQLRNPIGGEKEASSPTAPRPIAAPQKPAPLVAAPSLTIATEKLNSVTVSAPKVNMIPVPSQQAPAQPAVRPPAPVPAISVPPSVAAPQPLKQPAPPTTQPIKPAETLSPAAPTPAASVPPVKPAPQPPQAGYQGVADPYRERPE